LIWNQALANSLNQLGEAACKIILDGLKRYGILLSDDRIPLGSLRDVLSDLMGDTATEALLEHIVMELDRLYAEV
jgi:hypothetical protein